MRQRFAKNPIMPLGLFTVRNFWTGNIATAFIYGALALISFVLAVYLQQGAGFPATLAGLATLPITILIILFSSRVGGLSGRFGPRIFMTVGPILMGLATLLFLTVSEDFSYWWQVLPGLVLFGIGLTLTVSPLTSAILGRDRDRALGHRLRRQQRRVEGRRTHRDRHDRVHHRRRARSRRIPPRDRRDARSC